MLGVLSSQEGLQISFPTSDKLTVHHSALGRFAPGYIAAGDYFQAMLKEAERNELQWGCESYISVKCDP